MLPQHPTDHHKILFGSFSDLLLDVIIAFLELA
jgi:hypothetical protein